MMPVKLKSQNGVCILEDGQGPMAYTECTKAELMAEFFKWTVDQGKYNYWLEESLPSLPVKEIGPWFLEEEIVDTTLIQLLILFL